MAIETREEWNAENEDEIKILKGLFDFLTFLF